MPKTGNLLIQLGSPKSTSVADVKAYLHEFLTDPRLIPHSDARWWKVLLKFAILPQRAPISAANYAKITDEKGHFPLVRHSLDFAQKVSEHHSETVALAFALGQGPTAQEAIAELQSQGCQHIRIIPLFPQFAVGTTLSAKDAVLKALQKLPEGLSYELIPHFYSSPAFLDAQARIIQKTIDDFNPDKLLFSFHSYPLKRIHEGDPYEKHCLDTAQGIAKRLQNFDPQNIEISFQSKLGRSQWLEPSTTSKIEELAQSGLAKLAVACPAFVCDNLETLEEIGHEAKELFIAKGGREFVLVPSLNSEEQWCHEFAEQILQANRQIPREVISPISDLKIPQQAPPIKGLSPATKQALKLMALVLFMDSAGFSMIFPLFPSLLDYFLKGEQQGLFSQFLNLVHQFESIIGVHDSHSTVVLFGGLLSFIYGLLQFVVAPLLGSISDRKGRKPVLLFSMIGMACSYLIWGWAGSFAVLLLSRILAGLMGSSISSASAVVADLTDSQNRTKGMAVLGISFGMGFVFGPAIGGFSSTIRLDLLFPSLASVQGGLGLNPFSATAFLAFLASMTAAHFLFYKFKETNDLGKRTLNPSAPINPFKLFQTSHLPGVGTTNLIQFFYLLAFSGAEATLTFLTTHRLGYSAAENGLIFLFMGFLLIMVQGGYVRRKAHDIGEINLAKRGVSFLIPSMLVIAFAPNTWLLLLGLTLLSIGASLLNPSLNALVSHYSPPNEQGRIQGTFRSMGSLGRCLGPLLGAIAYWKFGATIAYLYVAAALLIPLFLTWKLPNFQKR